MDRRATGGLNFPLYSNHLCICTAIVIICCTKILGKHYHWLELSNNSFKLHRITISVHVHVHVYVCARVCIFVYKYASPSPLK